MKRTHRMLAVWGCCSAVMAAMVLPGLAAGQDAEKPASPPQPQAAKDVLSAVPADAWATLCVRNLAELDRKIVALSQQLESPMQMSMLQMAKGLLGMAAGVNDNGGMAVVIMPTQNVMMPMDAMVLFIPCSDFAGLTSLMQPEDVGDGVVKILFKNEPTYAAHVDGYALLGPSAETIKALAAAKGGAGIRSVWSPHQLKHFESDDLALWLNLQALVADPSIQGMLQGFIMMSASASGTDPAQAMEDIKAYKSLAISLRLDQAGLGMGFYMDFQEGSRVAKSLASTAPTKETLLRGLPKGNYIMAGGMVFGEAAATDFGTRLKQQLSNPMLAAQGLDTEKLKQAGEIIATMFGGVREVSFSFSGLPAGPDGHIGMTKVVTVESGAKDRIAKFAELFGLITSGLIPMPPEQEGLLAEIVQFKTGAETIGGAAVGHLLIQLDKVPDAEPDWVEKVNKIVGKEGLLFRIAAADDKHLVATFGGGSGRMEHVLKLVKSSSAPLSADSGIKQVAATLPAERTIEGYLSLGQLAKTIAVVQKLIGEEPSVPTLDVSAPLAGVGGPAGKTGFQLDMAVPMELIRAVKDVILAQMMAPPAGPPPAGAPGETAPGAAPGTPPASPPPSN